MKNLFENTAGILTYDKADKISAKERLLGISPMAVLFISSNTVMAVVPDSNRIPFYIYSVNNFSNRIFLSIFDFQIILYYFWEDLSR